MCMCVFLSRSIGLSFFLFVQYFININTIIKTDEIYICGEAREGKSLRFKYIITCFSNMYQAMY